MPFKLQNCPDSKWTNGKNKKEIKELEYLKKSICNCRR
jgi:hypothetical protein